MGIEHAQPLLRPRSSLTKHMMGHVTTEWIILGQNMAKGRVEADPSKIPNSAHPSHTLTLDNLNTTPKSGKVLGQLYL